jgi:hypothetical protein
MKPDPITNPDTENTDPLYWEKVLKTHNLSMTRGSNQNSVSYVGDLKKLVKIDTGMYEKETGRVVPQGSGPDK